MQCGCNRGSNLLQLEPRWCDKHVWVQARLDSIVTLCSSLDFFYTQSLYKNFHSEKTMWKWTFYNAFKGKDYVYPATPSSICKKNPNKQNNPHPRPPLFKTCKHTIFCDVTFLFIIMAP